jgi:methylthioribose-1-phosphate isomerase
MRALEWIGEKVRFIDQTELPINTKFIETNDYTIIAEAIKKLSIRGAPLIGIAAAYGVYLGIQNFNGNNKDNLKKTFLEVC